MISTGTGQFEKVAGGTLTLGAMNAGNGSITARNLGGGVVVNGAATAARGLLEIEANGGNIALNGPGISGFLPSL